MDSLVTTVTGLTHIVREYCDICGHMVRDKIHSHTEFHVHENIGDEHMTVCLPCLIDLGINEDDVRCAVTKTKETNPEVTTSVSTNASLRHISNPRRWYVKHMLTRIHQERQIIHPARSVGEIVLKEQQCSECARVATATTQGEVTESKAKEGQAERL